MKIQRLEVDLISCKIPGYFPTPPKMVEMLIDHAYISNGMRVLEPSAGKGDIAESIRANYQVSLSVCEIIPRLQEILELKGFNLLANDFFKLNFGYAHPDIDGLTYDRIVMNPPFEKGSYINHIRHAYDNCLAPGGRLVSLAPPNFTTRREKKYKLFKEWLNEQDYEQLEVEPGSFQKSSRPTGVSIAMIIINKP